MNFGRFWDPRIILKERLNAAIIFESNLWKSWPDWFTSVCMLEKLRKNNVFDSCPDHPTILFDLKETSKRGVLLLADVVVLLMDWYHVLFFASHNVWLFCRCRSRLQNHCWADGRREGHHQAHEEKQRQVSHGGTTWKRTLDRVHSNNFYSFTWNILMIGFFF